MDIYNETCLDISLKLRVNEEINDLGTSEGNRLFSMQQRKINNKMEASSLLGVNSFLLHEAYHSKKKNDLWLQFLICLDGTHSLSGNLQLPPFPDLCRMAKNSKPAKMIGIHCKSRDGSDEESITLSATCRVTMIDDYPLFELFLRPRLILRNDTFVNMNANTPMACTFSKCCADGDQGSYTHTLNPFGVIECYNSGDSVAFSFKCADNPIGGNKTGWNKHGWIDIPLGARSRLTDVIHSSFPFQNNIGMDTRLMKGCDFFIEELDPLQAESDPGDKSNSHVRKEKVLPPPRIISFAVSNVGIDHTGEVLFESWDISQNLAMNDFSKKQPRNFDLVYSSFPSTLLKRRLTLLPSSESYVRLLHLSMDDDDGIKRSLPFCIEDVAFCEGGIESTPIYWTDETESGYYAYRKISTLNQSELHIIPEFVIFNGGDASVRITVKRCSDFTIEAGKIAVAKKNSRDTGLTISVVFEKNGHTYASAPIQVEKIGK